MARYELTITAVSKDARQGLNGWAWGVKEPDGRWVNLYQEQRPQKGFMVVDLIEKPNNKGGVFRDAYPVKAEMRQEPQPKPQPQPPSPNYPPPEKPTVSQMINVIKRVSHALEEWIDKTPRGPEAVASVIQSVILGIRQREIDLDFNDPVSNEIRQAYEDANGEGWEELK